MPALLAACARHSSAATWRIMLPPRWFRWERSGDSGLASLLYMLVTVRGQALLRVSVTRDCCYRDCWLMTVAGSMRPVLEEFSRCYSWAVLRARSSWVLYWLSDVRVQVLLWPHEGQRWPALLTPWQRVAESWRVRPKCEKTGSPSVTTPWASSRWSAGGACEELMVQQWLGFSAGAEGPWLRGEKCFL